MEHLRRHCGFTLFETLVVLIILAITLSTGIPAFRNMQENVLARNKTSEIERLIAFARYEAITTQQRVTLCPIDRHGSCHADWNAELTVFTDSNNNRTLDDSERPLKSLPAKVEEIVERDFNNRAISFNHKGFSGTYAGSFSLCVNGSKKRGSAMIISRMGKIRYGTDRNGDGLPELPNGDNIPCS